jgi:hypothetical protein
MRRKLILAGGVTLVVAACRALSAAGAPAGHRVKGAAVGKKRVFTTAAPPLDPALTTLDGEDAR